MAYHIAEKRELRFAGIRIRLCEEMEENHKIVPHFWKETMQSPQYTELCQLSDTGTNAIFGISVYEDPDHIFYYIAVATSKKIPSRFHELRIPAATWAVFENKGNFKENVQDIFRRFYTEWLLFSGYEYARLPDIEAKPVQTQAPYDNQCNVWIAIHKEEEKKHGI